MHPLMMMGHPSGLRAKERRSPNLERVSFPNNVELLVTRVGGAQSVDDGDNPPREVVACDGRGREELA
jgi:hypothetical protein